MPPADAETTGAGSGATGLGPGLGFGLLFVVLLEPPEPDLPPLDEPPLPDEPPAPLPDEPPVVDVWLDELLVGAFVDEWFEEPPAECFDEALVPGLGETPPLPVVFVEPPLLDAFSCGFAFLAADVAVVVVAGVVCDVVVGEVVVAAAATDRVVLDFELLPPQALIATASATEHSRPATNRAPASPRDRAPTRTISKHYSSRG
jgi:hypothetical protein